MSAPRAAARAERCEQQRLLIKAGPGMLSIWKSSQLRNGVAWTRTWSSRLHWSLRRRPVPMSAQHSPPCLRPLMRARPGSQEMAPMKMSRALPEAQTVPKAPTHRCPTPAGAVGEMQVGLRAGTSAGLDSVWTDALEPTLHTMALTLKDCRACLCIGLDCEERRGALVFFLHPHRGERYGPRP